MASSTSASVRVEKATSDLLLAPDWTMNIDICDSINTDIWQAKDVVKAVKKRLQHKNPKVQFLALTLLETMIKNCGDYVHAQVVQREILPEMVKIVKKKTDMQVREKILVLLDSWQEAFGGPGGKYPQYYWAYMDLKRVGVEFPQRSRDSSLIFSPPGSHPRLTSTHPGYGMPSNSTMRLDEAIASDIGNLSLSDLDGMQHVMELLNDMLQAVNPNDRAAVKDELVVDLVSQCHTNQRKLMEFVSSTGDEELLEKGLSLNDSLQSLLAKHDAIASGSPLPAEVPQIQSIPSPTAPILEPIPEAGNHSKEEEDSEEDEFAQLARRNRPTTAQSMSASENSPNHSDITTASTTTSVSDSSVASNALVLSDPPPAVRTSTKEQDMIELLSITLSTNSSPPHTPLTPSTSHQTESPISTSSTEQGYPQNSPHFGNQGYVPSNTYVAPWAQQTPSQPQPVPLPPSQSLSAAQPTFQSQYQVPQYSSSYPPPPWATPAIGQSNPFLSNAYQHPSTQFALPAPASALYSRPLQQYNSFGRSSNTSSSAVGEALMTANQRQDSRPLQHYNSFGKSNNASSLAGEAQMTANQRQGSGNAAKPFVPSYRLFEDLIDLRNTDERIKVRTQTSLSGTSSQGMTSGRK